MKNPLMEQYRSFLKDTIRKRIDFSQTDQSRGIHPPPIEKLFSVDAVIMDLSREESWTGIPDVSLSDAIKHRKSHRTFINRSITLYELSSFGRLKAFAGKLTADMPIEPSPLPAVATPWRPISMF